MGDTNDFAFSEANSSKLMFDNQEEEGINATQQSDSESQLKDPKT